MINKLIDQPPLSPDIEWLLHTDQASDGQIIEAFLGEYFTALSQMIQVMLPNPALWPQALEAVLAAILLHRQRYQSDQRLLVWVDSLCFGVCQKLRKRLPGKPASHKSNTLSPGHTNKTHIMAQLPADQRLALYLSAVQGLTPQEIAETTRVKLHVATKRINRGKWWLAEKIIPEEQDHILNWISDERIKGSFKDYWQDLTYLIPDKSSFTEAVIERARHRRSNRHWLIVMKENAFAGLIAACLLVGVWLLNRSDPEPVLEAQKYTIPQTQEPSSRSFNFPARPPSVEGGRNFDGGWSGALSIWSGTNTILSQMKMSEGRMDRMLIEAHIHFEGFLGYDGSGVDYTIQTWMDQSNEIQLTFTGPADGIPYELYLMSGDKRFVAELDDHPSYQLQEIKGGEAIQSGYLRSLLFNPPSLSSAYQVIFRNQSLTLFAGREVLSVDQYGLDGKRVARLWLDTKTGFPMRQQVFSRIDDQQVILDVVVSRIEDKTEDSNGVFNANFSWITELGDGGGGNFNPGSQVDAAAGSRLADRPPGFSLYPPSPANLNLASTNLSFQFARTLNQAARSSLMSEDNLAWIFAGPYYLGKTDFGSPWQMICARSPDGRKLAYVENPDATGSAGTLHWLSLQPFTESRQLEPQITVSQLAFAQDNQTLAFFSSAAKAIYVLDTFTGVYHKLVEIPDVRSLVWSPDGASLAFIGRYPEPNKNEFVMVARTDTGEITYRRSIDFEVGSPSNDWPTIDWDVEFPVEAHHLEMCSLPASSS